jgi:BirA family biotin operon repressor/biotin-[acetyl-CoA-carboxylase] ligase
LVDEARAGAPDRTVAFADHQSAGRGRLERRWEAPRGANVLLSVLVRPSLGLDELHLCTVAVALAAVEACERVAGISPDLKWPNDLVVADHKLAGILAELVPDAPTPPASVPATQRCVVVGIGLNVRWPAPDGPGEPDGTGEPDGGGEPDGPGEPGEKATDPATAEEWETIVRTATSLWRETGTAHDPELVIPAFLAELAPRLDELETPAGRRHLAAQYRRRCVTVGRTVRVTLADDSFTGDAVDITVDGHLVVDVGACFKTVSAGDVVHVRAP